MSEQTEPTDPLDRPLKRLKKTKRSLAALMVLLILGLALVFRLSSAGVEAPLWLKSRFEDRLNTSLPQGRLALEGLRLYLSGPDLNPLIKFSQIEYFDPSGALQAVLPAASIELSRQDILLGKIRPTAVELSRADLSLSRDAEGEFGISFGNVGAGTLLAADRKIGDIFALLEAIFEVPLLSKLQSINTEGARISLQDTLSGRDWQFNNGRFRLTNLKDGLAGSIGLSLDQEGRDPAEATFSWRKPKSGDLPEFATKFSGFSSRDVADQVAALGWLKLLNAPISGSVTVKITAEGGFGDINGVLDIGGGHFGPGQGGGGPEQTGPLRFSGAKAYLSYNSKQEKLTFDQISLDTEGVRITAEGQAFLTDWQGRKFDSVVGQLKFTKVELNPEGVFSEPLQIDSGAIDLRVRLDPLVVDIGQAVLVMDETKITAKGRFAAGEAGWTSRFDLSLSEISRDRIMQIWPLVFKSKTRDWFADNVHAATIKNVVAAFRAKPGSKPRLNVGFDVSGAQVRYMKTLPEIEGGRGYGVLTLQDLTLVMEEGMVTAPDGGMINVAGSSMYIPDITIKEAPAIVTLNSRSSITSGLSVLDLKPFEFLSKAGVAVDLAEGTVSTRGTIRVPLAKKVLFEQITLAMRGELRNVSTDQLIKGKTLRAERLEIIADNSGVSIAGAAMLGELPVTARWRQGFGAKAAGISQVEAQVELSQKFLDEFNIALPKGTLTGEGVATVVVDLIKDKPPSFQMLSDLNRIKLSLAPLGWEKPKNVTGRLEVVGEMSSPIQITKLALKTKGLDILGSISLKEDGSLDKARLTNVDLDGWLKAPVEITTDRDGTLSFALQGGVADFRKSKLTSGGASGDATHIKIDLDQLVLSSGIVLTDLRGDLATGGGVSGSFSARVNGGAQIAGSLAPLQNGIGVRFTSTDAGAVLRSSGVFTTARGGALDMVLIPAKKRGTYEGTLNITDTRVVNASSLAELLSAISVVGLLEQLDQQGILFSAIDASFLMSPKTIELREASAVGSSMGITMEGVYEFDRSTINMQGVITPLYVLNGLLEQTKVFGGLFGKRKGEGLFGFNYTMKGPIDAPKIGVNPLSILTPGLFREIFKRPVPKPGQ